MPGRRGCDSDVACVALSTRTLTAVVHTHRPPSRSAAAIRDPGLRVGFAKLQRVGRNSAIRGDPRRGSPTVRPGSPQAASGAAAGPAAAPGGRPAAEVRSCKGRARVCRPTVLALRRAEAGVRVCCGIGRPRCHNRRLTRIRASGSLADPGSESEFRVRVTVPVGKPDGES